VSKAGIIAFLSQDEVLVQDVFLEALLFRDTAQAIFYLPARMDPIFAPESSRRE
jgi:hypothetical protein